MRWEAGFALGLGPSHETVVRDVLGLSYDHPGRNTEEYLRIVSDLLDGVDVDSDGTDWTTHSTGRMVPLEQPVSAGGGTTAADVAITGDESSVERQLTELLDGGVTDVRAQPVAVGLDRGERSASIRRTRSLLRELAQGR